MELKLQKVSLITSLPGGKSRQRLFDINLTWSSSERVGLLGRNGSGKTSLARLIVGLEKQTKGHVDTSGQHNVTIVMQRPEEHFQYETVGKQIHAYGKGLVYEAICNLLEQVGLPIDIINRPPLTLSTGQQRLVALACALSSSSQFIVLDEPMAGLDARDRALVRTSLRDLHHNRPVSWLIVSHHPDDLFGLVDRLWVLNEGQLVYDGPFSEVPLAVLDLCLDPRNVSLFYHIRQFEERGIALPKGIYSDLNPVAFFSQIRI